MNAPQDQSAFVAKKARLWERDELGPVHKRALEIGSAGEHLVCADLLLSGYRTFLASQGSPYDVVVDLSGSLVRITVKSTLKPKPRPSRPKSRGCYSFAIGRYKRDNKGKCHARAYTAEDVDIVAVVALDTRQIGYLWIGDCPTILHLHAPHGAQRTSQDGPKHSGGNRLFEDFTFTSALEALYASV